MSTDLKVLAECQHHISSFAVISLDMCVVGEKDILKNSKSASYPSNSVESLSPPQNGSFYMVAFLDLISKAASLPNAHACD